MSPRHAPQRFARKLIQRFANSRDFTLSFLFHLILVAMLGSVALYQIQDPPSDFVASESRFVEPTSSIPKPPRNDEVRSPAVPSNFSPAPQPPQQDFSVILRDQPSPGFLRSPHELPNLPPMDLRRDPPQQSAEISNATRNDIARFAQWRPTRSSGGERPPEFEFTAFVGQYSGGNWDSTNRLEDGGIRKGSLPNLLYFMSQMTKDRIRTNYRNVKAIRLDSDELFAVKPPFIFLTGTRDFQLTQKEVENLQRYIRMGGAIWGDSSVPGRNSRFDIAFRREMKRVLPDVDKEWEALPDNHPIFTSGYFSDVRQIPSGLNFYREPVRALKIYGQIAVLYTANDYGDLWQTGLKDGEIDLRRNARNEMVAVNESLWGARDISVRNISRESLMASYKFGSNVVVHLLTRWDALTRSAEGL